MKKQQYSIFAFILFFLFLNMKPVMAQVKTKMSAEELAEWNKQEEVGNALLKTTAAEKKEGKDIAQAFAAYVLKAILHRTDPGAYPIDNNSNSMEKITLDAVSKFSVSTMNKAKVKATELMANPQKKSAILGRFKDLNFKKASITPDIKKMIKLPARPAVGKMDDATLVNPFPEIYFVGTSGPSNNNSISIDNEPAVFNKLDLVLRKVHCVDETDPESGDDDMVIGGLLIGASGNKKSANSLASCHFDDGEVCNHGAYPFGTYSLNTTSGYPKVFYCIIQLIEVDTDEADAAKALTDVMTLVGTLVSTVNPAIGAIIVAVAQAVEIFTGWLIDDDPFYPYGIQLNLSSQTAFGSDGRSSDWHTGNISDHGGTYRLGFYWQLKN